MKINDYKTMTPIIDKNSIWSESRKESEKKSSLDQFLTEVPKFKRQSTPINQLAESLDINRLIEYRITLES